jgi:hypothetical protein
MSRPCHVELILEQKVASVAKEAEEGPKLTLKQAARVRGAKLALTDGAKSA